MPVCPSSLLSRGWRKREVVWEGVPVCMERANAFERSEASTSDRRLALHLLRSIVQLHKTEQNQGRDYFSNAKRDVESVWPHSQGGNQTPQSQNKETDQKRRPSVLPEPRLVQLFRRQRHYRSPAGDAQWATLNLGAQVRYSPPKLVVRVQISATACLSLFSVPVPECMKGREPKSLGCSKE